MKEEPLCDEVLRIENDIQGICLIKSKISELSTFWIESKSKRTAMPFTFTTLNELEEFVCKVLDIVDRERAKNASTTYIG